ncbi:MAG: diaminobutyrate acetyltransferase [Spirochaetales bacterium]|nr:diaminobutyrate acetyltransferase [Leptospiraceae bacterium]MCB1327371.1 diaminobutyrate acetyltransferase [Leptospiraceae bacterium]MCP5482680.1 diaminobutyrate acetyltransferase [Spirochaetales bacterium]MCP5485062.1 diaminobutyrate acetyltransferase [Spirochaetales bacterium]
MHSYRASSVRYRRPRAHDGGVVWEFVRSCSGLDLNSTYFYLIMCSDFSTTTAIAELDENLVGFAAGYVPPARPDTLFVWQIATAPAMRNQGIGLGLLHEVLGRPESMELRFLEATVTPSNTASKKLFGAFARQSGAILESGPARFSATDFLPTKHEAEEWIRIGPLTRVEHSGTRGAITDR